MDAVGDLQIKSRAKHFQRWRQQTLVWKTYWHCSTSSFDDHCKVSKQHTNITNYRNHWHHNSTASVFTLRKTITGLLYDATPNLLQCLMMPPQMCRCAWDDRKHAHMRKHNVFFAINVSFLNPYYYNSPKAPFRPSTQVCIWKWFRCRFLIMSSSSQSPWCDRILCPKVRKRAFCPFPPSYGGTYPKPVFFL